MAPPAPRDTAPSSLAQPLVLRVHRHPVPPPAPPTDPRVDKPQAPTMVPPRRAPTPAAAEDSHRRQQAAALSGWRGHRRSGWAEQPWPSCYAAALRVGRVRFPKVATLAVCWSALRAALPDAQKLLAEQGTARRR